MRPEGRPTRARPAALALIAMSLATACGSDNKPPEPTQPLDGKWDFVVGMTESPQDCSLTLNVVPPTVIYTLDEDEDGDVSGDHSQLAVTCGLASAVIPGGAISGRRDGSDVTLNFTVPDGTLQLTGIITQWSSDLAYLVEGTGSANFGTLSITGTWAAARIP